ncbi:toxic anion resistance protein [Paenibacillus tarimensis]|uniref:toxic anion resistance protein n=1 Tax=Paenibacillus tarimensis TaxID=416012 RepID=UPI001F47988B|nr:toxic anion resistance protein [Paenibacillus tarimensis]MCF2944591.1 toxic anion resistance protein [Paenibacillus tarimensis]
MAQTMVQLKREDLDKLEQEAERTMQRVSTTDALQLDTLMDEIGRQGSKTLEKSGQTLTMLERPLNDLMSGKRTDVANNMLKLRGEVEGLSKSKQLSLMQKLLRKTPIKQYVYRYQSAKTNVEVIVNSLRHGRENLEENVIHMRNLKRSSLENVYDLQLHVEYGNRLKELFEQEIAKPENADRKPYLERGLRKVVTKIQTFTEMIMLYQQAIAATDIINDTNDKLMDSVDSTIQKTQHLMTVSVLIAQAIDDQMKVIDAVNATNDMIGNQFADNARLLNESSDKANKALTRPAMSMELVERAMGDLFSAMDKYENSNRQIIQTVSEQTSKMQEINQQVGKRLGLKSGSPNPELESAAARSFLD